MPMDTINQLLNVGWGKNFFQLKVSIYRIKSVPVLQWQPYICQWVCFFLHLAQRFQGLYGAYPKTIYFTLPWYLMSVYMCIMILWYYDGSTQPMALLFKGLYYRTLWLFIIPPWSSCTFIWTSIYWNSHYLKYHFNNIAINIFVINFRQTFLFLTYILVLIPTSKTLDCKLLI